VTDKITIHIGILLNGKYLVPRTCEMPGIKQQHKKFK
jgi:hypothetical protein